MPQPWSEQDHLLQQAADRFGTPAYVYATDRIAERAQKLHRDFGRWFRLSYAVKTNPNTALLGWLKGIVPLLDVSSIGEVRRALRAGWDPELLSFTGPAKRREELAEALASGVGDIVLESLEEAVELDALAAAAGVVAKVIVRLSPDRVPKGFGVHMAGRPSPFGIDVEEAGSVLPQIVAMGNLKLAGFHIYSGTQSLKPDAIVENWQIFIAQFRHFCALVDLVPERLIFGSGLGIPHHAGDQPLDTAAIAAAIAPDLDALKAEPRFAQTDLVLELGRHLVGEAGVFVTRVLRVKASRGAKVVLCDGGMNAHLAATGQFGMVLRRNYMLHRVGGGEGAEKVDIHGPLCTSIDRLASGAELPPLAAGDLIAIHPSGAYGPTASPRGFISHPVPREILVQGGQMSDVTE